MGAATAGRHACCHLCLPHPRAIFPPPQLGGGPREADEERERLKDLIATIVDWDQVKHGNSQAIEKAQALILQAFPDRPPRLLDPFMGGGATGLKALCPGCEPHAVEWAEQIKQFMTQTAERGTVAELSAGASAQLVVSFVYHDAGDLFFHRSVPRLNWEGETE